MTDEAPAPAETDENSHQHADGTTHSHEGGNEPHHHHGDETHHHEGGDEPHHHHGELAHDHEGGDVPHQHTEDGSIIFDDEDDEERPAAAEAEAEEASEASDSADEAEDEAEAEVEPESKAPTEAETTAEPAEEPEAEGETVSEQAQEEATEPEPETDSEEEQAAEPESSETGDEPEEADPLAGDEGEGGAEEQPEQASETGDEPEEADPLAGDEGEGGAEEQPEQASEPEEPEEDAFEVRLVGGLSVLKDSRDPLYVMQAVTNLASTLVISWTMVALVLGWRDGDAANNGWWVLVAFIMGLTVLLVVVLEAFLSHDRVLQQKMERFSRWTQYFMTAWLVGLFLWSSGEGGPDLRGAEPLLEMTVVWLLLFTITEFINRFRLGKMEWKGGRDVMSLISSSFGGVAGLVTGAEVQQIKASSRSVMEGIRWVLDFASLLFFLMIVILTAASSGTTMEDALSHLPLGLDDYGLNVIVKPALWLGSVYLLIFLSETWLRLRPE